MVGADGYGELDRWNNRIRQESGAWGKKAQKLVQLLINGKAYADLHAKRLVAEDELRKIDAEIHAKNEGA